MNELVFSRIGSCDLFGGGGRKERQFKTYMTTVVWQDPAPYKRYSTYHLKKTYLVVKFTATLYL